MNENEIRNAVRDGIERAANEHADDRAMGNLAGGLAMIALPVIIVVVAAIGLYYLARGILYAVCLYAGITAPFVIPLVVLIAVAFLFWKKPTGLRRYAVILGALLLAVVYGALFPQFVETKRRFQGNLAFISDVATGQRPFLLFADDQREFETAQQVQAEGMRAAQVAQAEANRIEADKQEAYRLLIAWSNYEFMEAFHQTPRAPKGDLSTWFTRTVQTVARQNGVLSETTRFEDLKKLLGTELPVYFNRTTGQPNGINPHKFTKLHAEWSRQSKAVRFFKAKQPLDWSEQNWPNLLREYRQFR